MYPYAVPLITTSMCIRLTGSDRKIQIFPTWLVSCTNPSFCTDVSFTFFLVRRCHIQSDCPQQVQGSTAIQRDTASMDKVEYKYIAAHGHTHTHTHTHTQEQALRRSNEILSQACNTGKYDSSDPENNFALRFHSLQKYRLRFKVEQAYGNKLLYGHIQVLQQVERRRLGHFSQSSIYMLHPCHTHMHNYHHRFSIAHACLHTHYVFAHSQFALLTNHCLLPPQVHTLQRELRRRKYNNSHFCPRVMMQLCLKQLWKAMFFT